MFFEPQGRNGAELADGLLPEINLYLKQDYSFEKQTQG